VTVSFLDLSRKVSSLRAEIDAAIAGVVESGPYVLGPRVEEFERSFAEYCGAPHAVGVASGTDAITIGLLAVGVEAGDEVITTSNSGVPTIAAIEAAAATPVLVDVDPVTRTLDPARLEAAVTRRTRAIVAVHLYGLGADMQAIGAIARSHDLRLVEDAAQAVGAEIDGRRAGTLADAAAFSFYPTKNLGALGDGGAVVATAEDVAVRARRLRTYGEDARYHSVMHGRNSRLDPLQAAVLSVQLPHLDAWTKRRREIAAYYRRELAETSLELPNDAPGRTHVYHLFAVRSTARDTLAERLQRDGVGTLVHYSTPVHFQPAYEHLAHGGLAESERLCAEVISLPLYPELTDVEVESVAAAVRRAAD